MCYVVYLGTKLPLTTSEWDESNPSFFIEELTTSEQKDVKSQFSMEHVYYIGSHEGCGCGFSYDQEFDKNDKDIDDRKKSVFKFNELLRDILSKSDECEVFLCWGGDEAEKPERSQSVSSEFFSKGDWVEERPTFYKIKNSKSA